MRSDSVITRLKSRSGSGTCLAYVYVENLEEHPALKELRNGAKRDFRSKTLGTSRLIPAFNDDGQIA
jgi:hypothetical protein